MTGDNRGRILDLAIAAIDSGGEAAVRVNDIVAEAGVTPPALYHHFGSREGLVIAAQVARYSRQIVEDTVQVGKVVAKCTSRDELRAALIDTWNNVMAQRGPSRWVRTSALGSAYARPELEAALAKVQDEIIAGFITILEPCREKGWFRPGIDLASAISWQHSVLLGRISIERGQTLVDPDEWNRLALEAFVHAFFGS